MVAGLILLVDKQQATIVVLSEHIVSILMDDSKTVPIQHLQRTVEAPTSNTALEVNYNYEDGTPVTRIFSDKFTIGRHSECEIIFLDGKVSRRHVELHPARTRWVVRDLQSTNSTYLNGKIIKESPLPDKCVIQLGNEGPTLILQHVSNKQ